MLVSNRSAAVVNTHINMCVCVYMYILYIWDFRKEKTDIQTCRIKSFIHLIKAKEFINWFYKNNKIYQENFTGCDVSSSISHFLLS